MGDLPVNAVLTPDGAHVYVVNSGDNIVTLVDVATQSVTLTLPVGNIPSAVASASHHLAKAADRLDTYRLAQAQAPSSHTAGRRDRRRTDGRRGE